MIAIPEHLTRLKVVRSQRNEGDQQSQQANKERRNIAATLWLKLAQWGNDHRRILTVVPSPIPHRNNSTLFPPHRRDQTVTLGQSRVQEAAPDPGRGPPAAQATPNALSGLACGVYGLVEGVEGADDVGVAVGMAGRPDSLGRLLQPRSTGPSARTASASDCGCPSSSPRSRRPHWKDGAAFQALRMGRDQAWPKSAAGASLADLTTGGTRGSAPLGE